ncbi:MAG: hypothetical protein EOO73_21890 [Myxococcales bacterium]|nr:MAG: hypothetical protein EOO73_21890 [Myxococcales bacterium]
MPFVFYRLLLLLKLLAVLGYAGGLGASLLARSLSERRRAVHAVASPCLVVVWLTGYALVERLGVGLGELWVLGGIGGSFVSLAALVASLHVPRRAATGAISVLALAAALALMVFRPTWSAAP